MTKDYTCHLLSEAYLDDLFLDYFSGVDPSDTNTVEQCKDDFIDECKTGAKKEATDYLDERLHSNGYNWICSEEL